MSVCSIINNKGKIDIFRLMTLSVYSALIFAERTTRGCSVAGGGGRGQGEGYGNQDDIWQMLTYRILSEEGFFLVLCLRWYSDSLRPRRTWVPSVSSAAVLNSLGGLHPPAPTDLPGLSYRQEGEGQRASQLKKPWLQALSPMLSFTSDQPLLCQIQP